MGTIEYFKFDGRVFVFSAIGGVCRIRYTDDKGVQTIIDDSNLADLRKKVLDNFPSEVSNGTAVRSIAGE